MDRTRTRRVHAGSSPAQTLTAERLELLPAAFRFI
jgi:hypothetical protein